MFLGNTIDIVAKCQSQICHVEGPVVQYQISSLQSQVPAESLANGINSKWVMPRGQGSVHGEDTFPPNSVDILCQDRSSTYQHGWPSLFRGTA